MMTQRTVGGSQSRKETLRERIYKCHLSYIFFEEVPAKLESRRTLEELIANYISTLPHSQKFTYAHIEEVLYKSITENVDFSACQAAEAFQSLERYASNLLTQPWRMEYKMLKLYNGFYSHTVAKQLIDADIILDLMGYEYCEENTMKFCGPLDAFRVTSVSLDCFVASVECQVMMQIMEGMRSYHCSWKDIHTIRQKYICSAAEAIQLLQPEKLNQLKRIGCPTVFSHNYQTDASPTIKTGLLVDVSNNTWPASSQTRSNNMNYMVDTRKNRDQGSSSKLLNYCDDEGTTKSDSSYLDPAPEADVTDGKEKFTDMYSPEHFKHDGLWNNFGNPLTLMSSYYNSHALCGHPGLSTYPGYLPSCSEYYFSGDGQFCSCLACCQKSHLNTSLYSMQNVAEKALSDSLHKLSINEDHINGHVSSVHKSSKNHTESKPVTNNSGDENLSDIKQCFQRQSVESKPKAKQKADMNTLSEKWSCSACTYLNSPDKDVCDMCSKSRLQGPEVKPLVSGGRQCPMCTLVNEKNADACSVCETSLKDSPTYI